MEFEVKNILNKIKNIETNILEYIDNENDDDDEYFKNVINALKREKIIENEGNFKLILHLISNLSKNHQRTKNFYSKIYKILSTYSKNIQSISNYEKFIIFFDDPIMLLYLFENNLLKPDRSIQLKLAELDYFQGRKLTLRYREYFFKEFHSNDPFCDKEYYDYYSSDEYTAQKRNGENELYLCKLIREDLLEEFIEYANKNNLKLTAKIESRHFETNSILRLYSSELIEYAAFHGSIKIFKYLLLNKVIITDSIWIYGIHGNNPEIFHLIEEKLTINPENLLYYALLFHNYTMADYLINNYQLEYYFNCDNVQRFLLSNYNFCFLKEEYILDFNKSFAALCEYNYVDFVKIFLSNEKININQMDHRNVLIFLIIILSIGQFIMEI